MPESMRNAIATRKLESVSTGGKPVLVRIGKPRKIADAEWRCEFRITTTGVEDIQFGYGIDGLQALIQAIEGVRVFLQKTGRELSWEGGEEGDTGIPRLVPTFYGKEISERLNALIDSELEAFADAAEKQSNEERKGKPAKS